MNQAYTPILLLAIVRFSDKAVIASHSIAKEITKEGAVHAFNNKATRMAAEGVGPVSFDQFGQHIGVPSVMMQEVAWTQARREAGGDAPFNASQRQKAKADKDAASKRRKNESGIQDSLFD
jgi:hypothetical protein